MAAAAASPSPPPNPNGAARGPAARRREGYGGELDEVTGRRQGQGTQHFNSGDTYTGMWAGDVPHGRGLYTYSNGAVYDGDFANGKRHGRGRYTYASGDMYEGEWVHGRRSGHGRFTSRPRPDSREGDGRSDNDVEEDGFEYVGEFRESKMCGVGKITYGNGDVYEGEMRDDMRHGMGSLRLANGDCFSGAFEAGAIHGSGAFYAASVDRLFTVHFVNGTLARQCCEMGSSSVDPDDRQVSCQFNNHGTCVRCAAPSLSRLLEAQDLIGAPGVSPQMSPAESPLPPSTIEAIRRARALLEGRAAFLGVQVGESHGFVRVLAVKPRSTAWQIGLQRGQYILAINGAAVEVAADLVHACRRMEIGDQGVVVVCERDDPPTGHADAEGSSDARQLPLSARQGDPVAQRRPRNPEALGFVIGGNLHIKEIEFLKKVAATRRPLTEKTLENLERVTLRSDPICMPLKHNLAASDNR